MAEASQALTETGFTAPLNRLVGERALRQIGLIVGLALAVAAGISLYMWAREPVMSPLYSQLNQDDATKVMEALKAANIKYRVDENTGLIMVPADKVHMARMQLAGQGLPRGTSEGLEMLDKDQGFGTSQFVEQARYQHALEIDLGRSIATLQSVDSARVHLAIPKQSVFLQDQSKPTASVVVSLFPGRTLSNGQVSAIAHLVASSVPNLSDENVTVVDQAGHLLTNDTTKGMALSNDQFSYQQQVEQAYANRIEALLTPIVGAGNVRAQVSAVMDFSSEESTAEIYDPKGQVLRSEQTSKQASNDSGAQGIPGALSNQPPGGGTASVTGTGNAGAAGAKATGPGANANGGVGNGGPGTQGAGSSTNQASPTNVSTSSTKNYEISKTVRHITKPIGAVQRLSVAVLLDTKQVKGANGKLTNQPLSKAEIAQITTLVKNSIGFDSKRGDTVSVISEPFSPPVAVPPIKTSLLEQPWVWQTGRLLLASVLGLILILSVIRPITQAIIRAGTTVPVSPRETQGGTPQLADGTTGTPQLTGPNGAQQAAQLSQAREDRLQAAKGVVGQEPALAANVVKTWLSQDD